MFGVKKTLTCKVGCSMLHQALATMWDVSAYGWSQHPPLRLRCRILNVGAVNGATAGWEVLDMVLTVK